MRGIEVRLEQCQNERAGKTEDPRENPPTSGIFRHDSHMRKSGSDSARGLNQARTGMISAHLRKSPEAQDLEGESGNLLLRPSGHRLCVDISPHRLLRPWPLPPCPRLPPERKGGAKREIPEKTPPTSGIGIPRRENLECDPARKQTRFAQVGGEWSNH
ncbi:hypothetical protein PR048_004607 [Dryococelus australis]|uniref:Uncharacterized protein n=1 Tax=Dryococelus australis TaxID=614101 RepID=A0ABQ9I5Y2_9NEOP|nr:hypothetical protein PR048_004607 [Dryococelus australis]